MPLTVLLCGKFFRWEITFSRFNIYFVPFRGLFPVCFRDALTNMIYLDVQVYLYNSFVEVDVLVMCFNFWVFCSFGAFFTVSISALGLPWNKITTRDYFSSEMRKREKPYFFTFSGILFRYIQGLFQNLFMYAEILVLNNSTNSTSLIKESPLWKATFSDFHTTFFSLGRPAFRTVVVWCFPFFCSVEMVCWVCPCKSCLAGFVNTFGVVPSSWNIMNIWSFSFKL